MAERLLSTDHEFPMPSVAGWTESQRRNEISRLRAQLEAEGGIVTRETRVRNPAFDGRGERTTWTCHVEWSRG